MNIQNSLLVLLLLSVYYLSSVHADTIKAFNNTECYIGFGCNFSNASIWEGGKVPGNGDTASIYASLSEGLGPLFRIYVNDSITVDSIIVYGHVTFTVYVAGKVTVNDVVAKYTGDGEYGYFQIYGYVQMRSFLGFTNLEPDIDAATTLVVAVGGEASASGIIQASRMSVRGKLYADQILCGETLAVYSSGVLSQNISNTSALSIMMSNIPNPVVLKTVKFANLDIQNCSLTISNGQLNFDGSSLYNLLSDLTFKQAFVSVASLTVDGDSYQPTLNVDHSNVSINSLIVQRSRPSLSIFLNGATVRVRATDPTTDLVLSELGDAQSLDHSNVYFENFNIVRHSTTSNSYNISAYFGGAMMEVGFVELDGVSQYFGITKMTFNRDYGGPKFTAMTSLTLKTLVGVQSSLVRVPVLYVDSLYMSSSRIVADNTYVTRSLDLVADKAGANDISGNLYAPNTGWTIDFNVTKDGIPDLGVSGIVELGTESGLIINVEPNIWSNLPSSKRFAIVTSSGKNISGSFPLVVDGKNLTGTGRAMSVISGVDAIYVVFTSPPSSGGSGSGETSFWERHKTWSIVIIAGVGGVVVIAAAVVGVVLFKRRKARADDYRRA